jgi:DNA-binding HxlR family transcriptional regulator
MYEAVQRIVRPKRSLEVLALLTESGPLNYGEIEDRIETSSDVISSRLSLLVEYSLAKRDERSPRDVRYSATAKGETVLDRIENLNDLLEVD